jgi:hypothetical protein
MITRFRQGFEVVAAVLETNGGQDVVATAVEKERQIAGLKTRPP